MIASAAGLRYRYPGRGQRRARRRRADLSPGEIVLLAGPSGGGKTTLLRAFAGLVPHFHGGRFAGHVVVDGLDTRTAPPPPWPGAPASRSRIPRRRSSTAPCCATSPSACRTTASSRGARAATPARALDRVGALGSPTGPSTPCRAASCSASRWPACSRRIRRSAAGRADRAAGRRGRRGVHVARPRAGRLRHRRADRRAPPRPRRPDRGPRRRGRRRRARRICRRTARGRPATCCSRLAASPAVAAARACCTAIDLEVSAGAVVALHGANGTGKTTLLRLLAGLDRPRAGAHRAARPRRHRASRPSSGTRRWRWCRRIPAGSCSATRCGRRSPPALRAGAVDERHGRARHHGPRATGIRATSRPASGSASRSPPRWRPTRPCCCSTSRRAAWIPPAGRRSPG